MEEDSLISEHIPEIKKK